MPDFPIPPTPAPTKAERLKEELRAAKHDSERLFRYSLTGIPKGRVRRTVLFFLVAISVGASWPSLVMIPGLLALMILALTDQVVELV